MKQTPAEKYTNEILEAMAKEIKDLRARVGELERNQKPYLVAKFASDQGQSFTNNTSIRIDYEDQIYDPLKTVTVGANWNFVAPVSGYYRVDAHLMWASTTAWAPGDATSIHVNANLANRGYLDYRNDMNPGATTVFVRLNGSTVVYCPKGAGIYFVANQQSGGTLAVYSGGSAQSYNHCSIHWLAGA